MSIEPSRTAFTVALGIPTEVLEEAVQCARDFAKRDGKKRGAESPPGQDHYSPRL